MAVMTINAYLLSCKADEVWGKHIDELPKEPVVVDVPPGAGDRVTINGVEYVKTFLARAFEFELVAKGPCGHLGTEEVGSWVNGQARCSICGERGNWYIPKEFFLIRADQLPPVQGLTEWESLLERI